MEGRADWDTFWRAGSHEASRVTRLNEKILANILALGDMRGKRVLEVGSGFGADSEFLATRGAHATVLDYSREALDLVRARLRNGRSSLSLVEADANRLPFSDNTFDVVFHQGFLEHFRNPLPLLEEQRRVLKPGGHLVVDVPQKYTLFTVKKWLRMRRGDWIVPWETQFSLPALEALVRGAGLRCVTCYGWGIGMSFGMWLARAVTAFRARRRTTPPLASSAAAGDPQVTRSPGSPRFICYLTDSVGVVVRKPTP